MKKKAGLSNTQIKNTVHESQEDATRVEPQRMTVLRICAGKGTPSGLPLHDIWKDGE